MYTEVTLRIHMEEQRQVATEFVFQNNWLLLFRVSWGGRSRTTRVDKQVAMRVNSTPIQRYKTAMIYWAGSSESI